MQSIMIFFTGFYFTYLLLDKYYPTYCQNQFLKLKSNKLLLTSVFYGGYNSCLNPLVISFRLSKK